MIPLFTGYDAREAVGLTVFQQSVRERCAAPWPIVPLGGQQRDGTNRFTYARFEVAARCGFEGLAVYCDGVDMLLRADLAELLLSLQPGKAVHVVKHDYRTSQPRKYRGTEMEAENADYPRKNWSSLVVWDCAHLANRWLTPENIAGSSGQDLHRFRWLDDHLIGSLPLEWNWLDEYGENEQAKLVHWTTGIPGFSSYRQAPHAVEWQATLQRTLQGLQTHQLSEV